MRIAILVLLAAAGWASAKKQAAEKPKPKGGEETTVTYFVKEEPEKDSETITINLKLKKGDPSLVETIEQARQLEEEIRQIYYDFCNDYGSDTCAQQVESSEYDIEAEYYFLRGNELFKTFVVEFEMSIAVRQLNEIGILVDMFAVYVQDGTVKLDGIEWEESDLESKEQLLMEQGLDVAKQACTNLGMELKKIQSVQVWEPPHKKEDKPKPKEENGDEEEEQEQQQEQEDEPQEEEAIVKYKFIAKCKEAPKQKSPKSKDKSGKKKSKK